MLYAWTLLTLWGFGSFLKASTFLEPIIHVFLGSLSLGIAFQFFSFLQALFLRAYSCHEVCYFAPQVLMLYTFNDMDANLIGIYTVEVVEMYTHH